jgi:hypothetical protein
MDSDGRGNSFAHGAATHNGPCSPFGEYPNPNGADAHWWTVGTYPA